MWRSTLLCMIFCFVVCVSGSKCKTIEGKWYNQLGSEVIVNRNSVSEVTGEYRSAVERTIGAAGRKHSVVKGVASSASEGGLISFSVLFNGGSSATAWIGECLLCGEEEILETTWILRKKVDTCDDRWKSTLINEDTFRGHETVDGPRKHLDTHTPKRPADWVPDYQNKSDDYSNKLNEQASTGLKKLRGKWYSSSGSELELLVDIFDGTIKGTYLEGYSSTDRKRFHVIGFIDPRNPSGIFGLNALSEDSEIMAVWVGQFHSCKNGEVLETSTLRRAKTEVCNSRVKFTNFAIEAFTRELSQSNDEVPNESRLSYFFGKTADFFRNLVGY